MSKIFFLLIISFLFLKADLLEYEIKPKSLKSSQYMNINILDSKELKFDKHDGIEFTELSALAFKKKRLFGLSDRGYLYEFKISIKNNKIKILELQNALKLKNKQMKPLKKSRSDSEGMVIVDDKLYISFEGKPRVDVFSLNGIKIKKHKVDKELREVNNYRGKNKALESIAYSNKHGIVTAPEVALKNGDKSLHTIYGENSTWSFSASGSLSALEFISDNEIIALEREFNYITRRRVITLTKVVLNRCNSGVCQSEVLAKFQSKDGWRLYNFEGLTKVDKNRFLMVSDSDGSLFQKTILVLFEISKN